MASARAQRSTGAPPALWLYGAVRPGTDDAFALVLPDTDAASMQVLLDRFARDLAPGVHAALLMDQAGWHTAHAIIVPGHVSLIHLPPPQPFIRCAARTILVLPRRWRRQGIVLARCRPGRSRVVAARSTSTRPTRNAA